MFRRVVSSTPMQRSLGMQFAAVQRMPMQNRVGLATNLQRIVSHPQFRMYADTAVAKATGPKPEGLLKMDEVKSLSELKFNYPDASLSDAALEAKVFNRLKELEAQVMTKAKTFNEANPFVFDPKRAATDVVFLCSLLCFVLFVIFLYNQYVEFADELAYEIRDGIFGAGFYFLLGLHGGHVIVGTVMLGILAYWSAIGTINGQSLFLRGTSLYVHLVDLVFVVLVFTVYAGKNSPTLKALPGDLAPRKGQDGRYATIVDEEGNVLSKQFKTVDGLLERNVSRSISSGSHQAPAIKDTRKQIFAVPKFQALVPSLQSATCFLILHTTSPSSRKKQSSIVFRLISLTNVQPCVAGLMVRLHSVWNMSAAGLTYAWSR
eukprot:CAMPEP_0174284944 /NCGR_PEP_ID=MMETSP0809-20121228/7291_1 /TAXON_ID=73025 ORGANISM="Eutreptiella gymnastica-like, Strain CCMP1594" /NCGR_SAMPLE_ID=MMETSP0809 /ASSEMBLY_ACC=CAM_ASM_000658 /LENGTH=375 /DNA_ID=CAMNT_0015380617 /DNA_START=34 /DNA_END=1162 /DNA_ORIENTATION=+